MRDFWCEIDRFWCEIECQAPVTHPVMPPGNSPGNATHPLNIIYLWTNSSRKTAYIPWEHTIRGFRNCFQKNWGIPVSWENDTFSCSYGPKFRFWSHFGPLDPFFLPKLSFKCPNMKVGHVVGPHWYLHKIPRSSNMPTEAIFVDPICQSRPKMGQILCFLYFMCFNS